MSEQPGTASSPKGLDLFLIKDFLDGSTCANIFEEMRAAPANASTVYLNDSSGVVDVRMRSASSLQMRAETVALVRRALLSRIEILANHFGVPLTKCEDPQFLRYRTGDFFVAHQDGNTGLIRSEREQFRKISVSVFLNDESEIPGPQTYGGGSLVFHPWRGDSYHLRSERGTLAAFRSETTHEVIPITHGERYSIACWFG
jgi:predicted 2-oxoglutarate/Fe(II)-dependent dioxygenase YbiX